MRNWLIISLLALFISQPAHAILLNSDQTAETVDVRSLKGIVPLTKGGTNASLTASNGGIVYSNSSAFAVLAGTNVAGRIVLSGTNAAPSWSTASYPSTIAAGQIVLGVGTNQIGVATMSGDCTMTSGGVISCTSSGGATPAGSNGDIQYKSSGVLAGLTLSANTVLGALSNGNPTALALPDCDGTGEALNYTLGVGFSCRTISTTALVPSIIQHMTSGTSATVSAANTTLSMESASTAQKNIAIPTCNSGNSGQDIVVKDASNGSTGTATTYHIVITPSTGTIDGASTASVLQNKNSLTVRCDGSGNWMLI